jgi:hypothetical protein
MLTGMKSHSESDPTEPQRLAELLERMRERDLIITYRYSERSGQWVIGVSPRGSEVWRLFRELRDELGPLTWAEFGLVAKIFLEAGK